MNVSTPGFEIKFIGDKIGKGLFAAKDYKKDDIVFEEDPIVSCQFSWNSAYGYAACDFCMRPLETAQENVRRLSGRPDLELLYPEMCSIDKSQHVQCSFCGVKYCCLGCLNLAWDRYHKTLCLQSIHKTELHPLEQLNEAWKHIHYPPETASIMLLARIIASVIQAPNQEIALNQYAQFCHKTFNEEDEIAHKLLGEQFAQQLHYLRELVIHLFPEDHAIQHWLTPEGFRSLFALVGTNGQGVGTSALSAWVKNVSNLNLGKDEKEMLDNFIDDVYNHIDEESGEFLNNEGSGLYALQSACNHSCNPNAEVAFLHGNFHLSLVALRDIQPGEEICISYLDECMLNRSRHSRHKKLRENYIFTCSCDKCELQVEDPDVTSEEEISDEEIDN